MRSFTKIPLCTLPPISRTRALLARTPTASTRTSNSTVFPLFSMAVLPSKHSTLSPSKKRMPFDSRRACIMAAQSVSRILESTRSARSHTVMLAARSFRPSAHLSPMRPAPTIRTLDFVETAALNVSVSSIVIKENGRFTVSSPATGGMTGAEPAATQRVSKGSVLPLSRITVLALLSMRTALCPYKTLQPVFS